MTVRFKDWDCELRWGFYGNGRRALELYDNGPIAKATVNIPEVELAEDEVCIKDWSENEGMLDALVEAGIVEDTGRRVEAGFVTAPVARIKKNGI